MCLFCQTVHCFDLQGTYCGDKEKWVDIEIAKKTGLPHETINAVIKSYYESLTQGILEGKSHSVTNFGTYYLKQVAATTARNPKTRKLRYDLSLYICILISSHHRATCFCKC